jgi:large subunit ribosomal protein L5
MADKKDKSKETKGGDQKKAAKAPKAAGKVKASAAAAKAETAPAEAKQKAPERIPTPRMKQRYHDVVVPAMMKQFQYKNPMQTP